MYFHFTGIAHGAQECINIRYMLRRLGVQVNSPCHLFRDNLGVIQNTSNAEADVRKKHVTICFHLVREIIAVGIISPHWITDNSNLSDLFTKQINGNDFLALYETLFLLKG